MTRDELQHTMLDRLRKDELRNLARAWVAALMDDANWLDDCARDENATAEELRRVIQKCYAARRRI